MTPLGHDVGDLLLTQVAARLVQTVREVDTVARFGGDEFVVMLDGLSSGLAPGRGRGRVRGRQTAGGPQHSLCAGWLSPTTALPSIGIALFGQERHSVDELLSALTWLTYQAKAAGRNTQRFLIRPCSRLPSLARASLEVDLRQGLAGNELFVHYQPVVDARGRVQGAEALARWRHPVRGLSALPNSFRWPSRPAFDPAAGAAHPPVALRAAGALGTRPTGRPPEPGRRM